VLLWAISLIQINVCILRPQLFGAVSIDDGNDVKYCADLDFLESLRLQRVRENKQYLKMAAKCDKDLDLLRRKHEKVYMLKFLKLDLKCDRASDSNFSTVQALSVSSFVHSLIHSLIHSSDVQNFIVPGRFLYESFAKR